MTVIFNRYFSEVARYFREVAIEDKRKQVLKEETWKSTSTTHPYLSSLPTKSNPQLRSKAPISQNNEHRKTIRNQKTTGPKV